MIIIKILCDTCNQAAAESKKNDLNAVMILRASLKKLGWTHTRGSGKDFCPTCSKARDKKE